MRMWRKMARRHAGYAPSAPFAVPMVLLVPTVTNVRGARVKAYQLPSGGTMAVVDGALVVYDETGAPVEVDQSKLRLFYGSFRTFGGTERMYDDVYTLEDTATIDTWYYPSITADCRIYVLSSAKTYEIMGTPENIDMRNQFCAFKVRAIGGV